MNLKLKMIIENQKKIKKLERYFFPINQETNFKINKFFRIITKNKKKSTKILNIKGRNFKFKIFMKEFQDLILMNYVIKI